MTLAWLVYHLATTLTTTGVRLERWSYRRTHGPRRIDKYPAPDEAPAASHAPAQWVGEARRMAPAEPHQSRPSAYAPGVAAGTAEQPEASPPLWLPPVAAVTPQPPPETRSPIGAAGGSPHQASADVPTEYPLVHASPDGDGPTEGAACPHNGGRHAADQVLWWPDWVRWLLRRPEVAT